MALRGWDPRVPKDVHTACRRPCLLRAVVERDVDAVQKKASCWYEQQGHLARPVLDKRAVTLDLPPRVVAGLHKGGFNSERQHLAQFKGEQLRSLRALCVPTCSHEELITHKSRVTLAPDCHQRRTKADTLSGVPLSGRGASIELISERHSRGTGYGKKSVAAVAHDAKVCLDTIDIDHQFQRKRCFEPSTPSHCNFRDNFEHTVRARSYASVIGRSGNACRRISRPSRSPSPDAEASHISDGACRRESRPSRSPSPDAETLGACSSEKDVFFEEGPRISKKVQELAASPKQRLEVVTTKGGYADSPPAGFGGRLGTRRLISSSSDASLTSATTAATPADVPGLRGSSGGANLSLCSGTSSPGVACSGPQQRSFQQAHPAMAHLTTRQRDELWKAKRRAAWL